MNKTQYMADWHQRNKERRIPNLKAKKELRKFELRTWIQELKETTKCADCNLFWPYYVMQFDHLHDKELNISSVVSRGWSKSRIQTEIDKCELVCSNCHAIRTHNRKAV